MVDRQSRDALATLLEAFLRDRVTGPELLRGARNLERDADAAGELDAAVEAVSERLHGCLARFDGTGSSVTDRGGPEFADQLEPRDWDCFVRCVAFLRGNGELAWPRADWAGSGARSRTSRRLTRWPERNISAELWRRGLRGC